MKSRALSLCLFVFFSLVNPGNTFLCPIKSYRKVRLHYAITMRKNEEAISKTTESISSNMVAIVKDDLANDLLYYAKFYHLLADDKASYFYIVFYEMLSFVLRNERYGKRAEIHVSAMNIMLYILVKNIILNHRIHQQP